MMNHYIKNRTKSDESLNTQSNRYLRERMATYADIAEDLIATGIYQFLPYHDTSNPQGDKSRKSGDIIWDVRLLKQSLDQDRNIFEDYYRYVESDFSSGNDPTITKERLDTVASKKDACGKIMSLRKEYGQGYEKGTALSGLIDTYAGSKDSQKDSEFFAENILSPMLTSAFEAIFYEEGRLGIHMPRDGTRPRRSRTLSESESLAMIRRVEDSIYRSKHSVLSNLKEETTDISNSGPYEQSEKEAMSGNFFNKYAYTNQDTFYENKTDKDYLYTNIVRDGAYNKDDNTNRKVKRSYSLMDISPPNQPYMDRLSRTKSNADIERSKMQI